VLGGRAGLYPDADCPRVRSLAELAAAPRAGGGGRISATLPAEDERERDSFARFLKHFPRGTVLFNEGDEGEDMYIHPLRPGGHHRSGCPTGEIVLGLLEKGDFSRGWPPRADPAHGRRRDGGVTATSSSIGSDVFGDMVKGNPEIAVRIAPQVLAPPPGDDEADRGPEGAGGRRRGHTGVTVGAAGRGGAQGRRPASRPEAIAYFISKASGKRVHRCSSPTRSSGATTRDRQTPEVDLTHGGLGAPTSRAGTPGSC